MAFISVLSLVTNDPKHFIYVVIWWILRKVNICIQLLHCWLRKTSQKSVTIFRVIGKRKHGLYDLTSSKDFLALYTGTVDTDYLETSNISLYCLDQNFVYFVETDPIVDITEADTFPFLYIAQFRLARRLFCLTLEEFCNYVEHTEGPEFKVLLLTNTGRCGSTLLTQIFNSTKRVLTIAEPDALTNIKQLMLERKLHEDMLGRLLQATFHFLTLRGRLGHEVKVVMIKPRSMCLRLVPLIHKYCPWVLHLFLYRQGLPTTISMHYVWSSILPTIEQVQDDPSTLLHEITQVLAIDIESELLQPDIVNDSLTLVALVIATSMSDYVHYRTRSHIPISCIRYENLVEAPIDALKRLSKHYNLGFTDEETKRCAYSVQMDSQRGFLSKNKKESKQKILDRYTPECKRRCDLICKTLGVPLMESMEDLPGMIK